MSRRTRKANVVRVVGIGIGALFVLAAGIRLASAAESGGNQGSQSGGGQAAPTVSCPSVVDKLPVVPAAAQAGVSQELANLDREIAEANRRLVTTRGQGGPNFVQNAILGPLKDKRVAVLDRIAIDIGRVTGQRPAGLEALAPCGLNQ